MNILDKIIFNKRIEVSNQKARVSIKTLESSLAFIKNTKSLSNCILNSSTGIIAEHKRRSPSKDIINNSLLIEDVVKGYSDNNASGISILTDEKYFGGSLNDLNIAYNFSTLPILRKEFIIDEYQIIEAKANGADAVLLIASVLTFKKIKELTNLSLSLNLEVLLEVHNLKELQDSLYHKVKLIGINNRNLKTFTCSLQTSKDLVNHIPDDFVKISESGLSDPNSVKELIKHGFNGFLIGETFMKTSNPGLECSNFIKAVLNET